MKRIDWNTRRTSLVDNLDFITMSSLLPTETFNHDIKSNLGEVLGQGSYGRVVNVKTNNSIVVKITEPCGKSTDPVVIATCRDISNPEAIQKVPSFDGKSIVIFPNPIGESIIPMILTDLEVNNYSDHFVPCEGVYVSPYESKVYAVLKKVNTDIGSVIKTDKDVYSMLFQLAYALYVAQNEYNFTHYDLHFGNVLYEDIDSMLDGTVYNYVNDKGERKSLFIDSRFKIKISDFGFSRIETTNCTVKLKNDNNPPNYGLFDPYYDLVSIMNNLLTSSFVQTTLGVDRLYDLTAYITGIPEEALTRKQKKDKLDQISSNLMTLYTSNGKTSFFWRPDRNYKTHGYSLKTPREMLDYLADKIGTTRPEGIVEETTILPILRNVKVRTQLYPLDTSKNFHDIKIDNSLVLGYQKVRLEGISYYNRNISLSKIEKCGSEDIYVYSAKFDPLRNIKFTLCTSCCDVDPVSFMRNKIGFCMIGSKNSPKGRYRTTYENGNIHESNLPITDQYVPYYATLSILKGEMKIRPYSDPSSGTEDYSISSGPLLVSNGIETFTVDTLNQKENNTFIFQCKRDGDVNSSNYSMQNGKCVKDRPKIEGRLISCNPSFIDAGNRRKRNAVIITKSGKYIFLSTRGEIDMILFTELCMKLNAKDAIALDSDTSSFLFNITGNSVQSFENKAFFDKPLGNILAVCTI